MTILSSEWPNPSFLLVYASDRKKIAPSSPGTYHVFDEEAKNSCTDLEAGLKWSEGLTSQQCLEFLEEVSRLGNAYAAILIGPDQQQKNHQTLEKFIDELRDLIALNKPK